MSRAVCTFQAPQLHPLQRLFIETIVLLLLDFTTFTALSNSACSCPCAFQSFSLAWLCMPSTGVGQVLWLDLIENLSWI